MSTIQEAMRMAHPRRIGEDETGDAGDDEAEHQQHDAGGAGHAQIELHQAALVGVDRERGDLIGGAAIEHQEGRVEGVQRALQDDDEVEGVQRALQDDDEEHGNHRPQMRDDDVPDFLEAIGAVDLGGIDCVGVHREERGIVDQRVKAHVAPDGLADDQRPGPVGVREEEDRLVDEAEPDQDRIDEADGRQRIGPDADDDDPGQKVRRVDHRLEAAAHPHRGDFGERDRGDQRHEGAEDGDAGGEDHGVDGGAPDVGTGENLAVVFETDETDGAEQPGLLGGEVDALRHGVEEEDDEVEQHRGDEDIEQPVPAHGATGLGPAVAFDGGGGTHTGLDVGGHRLSSPRTPAGRSSRGPFLGEETQSMRPAARSSSSILATASAPVISPSMAG
jgi:hypothetical protein